MDNKLFITAGICLLIGSGVGYYLTPVQIKEHIVIKTVIKREKETHVKRDTVITKSPDGTTKTEIRDRTEVSDNTRTDSIQDKTKTTTRDSKDWIAQAAASVPNGDVLTFGISRRIIGELYLGVFGNTDREFSAGLSFRF